MRADISWSYNLLDEEEREVFQRLSVFVGAFDLDAAAAVDGRTHTSVADIIGRLVDKSLVDRPHGASGRWRMLATIRAYAAEQLSASQDRPDVQRRHLRWAVATGADLETRLRRAG
jgi:predicted ATPase